jgi:hypothetical protein
LLAALPATVPAFLASEDATTLAIARWLEGHPAEPIDLEALPDAEQVLARLCNDPDPPLAAWSQAVLERRNPALAATLRDADTGLPAARPSPEASGGSIAELLASPVAQSSLISCLDPSALLQLPQLGTLRRWEAGEPLALGPTALAILLGGACEAAGLRREARPGPDQEGPTILGLLDHFGGPGTGRSLEGLRASPEGCDAAWSVPAAAGCLAGSGADAHPLPGAQPGGGGAVAGLSSPPLLRSGRAAQRRLRQSICSRSRTC